MFMTFTGLGLAGVIVGAIITAKAIVSTNDEALVARSAKENGPSSSLFGVLDDQRIATSLGLSLIFFGAIVGLLHFSGLTLESTGLTIIASLVLMFMIAHARYARQLRATQPQRLADLLARIAAAQDNAKVLTPNSATGC